MARLVHRRTGSVAVVPDEKVAALSILGYEPERGSAAAKKAPAKAAAKKAPAKKAAAKSSK